MSNLCINVPLEAATLTTLSKVSTVNSSREGDTNSLFLFFSAPTVCCFFVLVSSSDILTFCESSKQTFGCFKCFYFGLDLLGVSRREREIVLCRLNYWHVF